MERDHFDDLGKTAFCKISIRSLRVLPNGNSLRCNFQDQRNPNIRWSLVDSSLTSGNTEIKIRPYYESEEKRRIGSTLMGYSFAFSDTIRALVDISSARNEAVWIHPNLETHSALATAAASSAFILKHRQLHYSQQMDQIDARSDFGM